MKEKMQAFVILTVMALPVFVSLMEAEGAIARTSPASELFQGLRR